MKKIKSRVVIWRHDGVLSLVQLRFERLEKHDLNGQKSFTIEIILEELKTFSKKRVA